MTIGPITLLSVFTVTPALYLTKFVDCACKSFNLPQWQALLPFGLGDPDSKMGLLSHQMPGPMSEIYLPKLTTYSDFVTANNLGRWSLSTMTQFAKVPSTSLGDVTSTDSLVVLLALVFSMRTLKGILIPFFCSIGIRAARSTHGPDWEKLKENQERIMKFGEYVFRLMYHFTVSAFGVWFFWDKPWWDQENTGTKLLFENHPNQPIGVGMSWYYMVQCAYNIEAMLSLLELSFIFKFQTPFKVTVDGDNGTNGSGASEIKFQSPLKISWSPNCRGDFQEMCAHHIITNLLVIGSSRLRFTRIGSMVFLVHDISDVPVDLSKLANFMKWKITTVVCFVTLLAVWAIARLGILPFVIVKSAFFEASILIEEGTMHEVHYHMIVPAFRFLLVAINALHVLWFVILLRIGYRLVMKGEVHDLAEHKQGEYQGKGLKKEKAT